GKAKADSSLKSVDSTNKQTAKTDSTADTTKNAGGLAEFKSDDTAATTTTAAANDDSELKKHLYGYIQFLSQPYQENGKTRFPAAIGTVAIKDTAMVRSYLENTAIRSNFPAQMVWMYGIAERGENNKMVDRVPLY